MKRRDFLGLLGVAGAIAVPYLPERIYSFASPSPEAPLIISVDSAGFGVTFANDFLKLLLQAAEFPPERLAQLRKEQLAEAAAKWGNTWGRFEPDRPRSI